jgi:hypothetical protein
MKAYSAGEWHYSQYWQSLKPVVTLNICYVISHRLLTTEAQVNSRVIHMGFLMPKCWWGRFSSEHFGFLLPVIQPVLHTHPSSGAGTADPFEASLPRESHPILTTKTTLDIVVL